MKKLTEYIFEALTANNDEEVKKLSEEILDILKKQGNLKKFVTTLNKLLEKCSREDNAAVWYAAIKDLFDGEYGNGQKYDAKYENISVKDLYPTQSEIDIENSAKWLSTKFINMGTVDAIFTKNDTAGLELTAIRSAPAIVCVAGISSMSACDTTLNFS